MLHPIVRRGVLALFCVAGATAAGVTSAQEAVFKWVDEQGVPHYSDQPPLGADAQQLDIRFRRTDRAAVQANARERDLLNEAADIREGQEGEDASLLAADRQRVLAERLAACEQAKERADKYSRARRLYKPGPDGERSYLSDEEIDAERAAALRAVDEWCTD